MKRKLKLISSFRIPLFLIIGLSSFLLFNFGIETSLLADYSFVGETIITASSNVYLPIVHVPDMPEWPMLAANPQRTSFTEEEVWGNLDPVWYLPFEAYIPQKVQIIAANNSLYVATSNGLYALDPSTGAIKWQYATELPLGHSPTIHKGVAYVGGHDRKLHAINATTGQGIWTFEAGAGFETNPLVINNIVYAGNRDGRFYAVYATGPNAGELAWQYETGGPILYSAAYQDGNVYFSANDGYAYALNAFTGTLVWQSDKLPGGGFYSWWPVVYEDRIIYSVANNYGTAVDWGGPQLVRVELEEMYGQGNYPRGELIGQLGAVSSKWTPGTPTINANRILDYLNTKPWRRTVFVLNRSTGVEAETAPVLWTGTHSGSRFPPVVGIDGVLYQQNNYMADPTIAGGQVTGWVPGVSHISVVSSDWAAVDEPHAYSVGGNVVYWNLCCDRQAGMINVTLPNTVFPEKYNAGLLPPTGNMDKNRERTFIGYDLDSQVPGYDEMFKYNSFAGPNGSDNGVYGYHGDNNPPIPYQGMVYMHRSNAVIAFGIINQPPVALPPAQIQSAPNANVTAAGPTQLKSQLAAEVQTMLDAGHLRPAYLSHGLLDSYGGKTCGDDLVQYWHHSAETLYTLALALPHLPTGMQQAVRDYLQTTYSDYPPYHYNNIGWDKGNPREAFLTPPEIMTAMTAIGPATENPTFRNNGGWESEGVWRRNPFAYYALVQYAKVFGNASTIWSQSQSSFWVEFNEQPSDTLLLKMPFVHNAYIAGYQGFLELENLAGQPESVAVRQELNRLLQLRVNNFSANTAYLTYDQDHPYCRNLNVSSNFLYMTSELADYLRTNALNKVVTAVDDYQLVAPYWFVSLFSGGYRENAITPLYDTYGLFVANALILQTPAASLEKYLDVPGFARGDLYHIQKLILTIEQY